MLFAFSDPGIEDGFLAIVVFTTVVLLMGGWLATKRGSLQQSGIAMVACGMIVLVLILLATGGARPPMGFLIGIGLWFVLALGRICWPYLPTILEPSTRMVGAVGVLTGAGILILESTILEPGRGGRIGILMIFFGMVMVIAPDWVDSISQPEDQ